MGRSRRSTAALRRPAWRPAVTSASVWRTRCPPKTSRSRRMQPLPVGCGLVGMDPVSHSIFWEQVAHARAQDTWQALLEQALSGLNCRVIQSTSAEAPGLLAYVAQPLRAHHSPDLFQVQRERSKAVTAPLA